MTNRASFLKQQLSASLGLPWQDLLDESQIEQLLDKHKDKGKRERLF